MPLNTSDLENRIQQKIDGLTTANSSIEFVIPSMTEVSNVKSTVANTASLPNIYTDGIPNGTVVFVESLGVPVIASKCSWLGLDGRLLQKDVQFGLWSWGVNSSRAQLGDGTLIDRCSPVSVVGGFTDWCQVSTKNNTMASKSVGLKLDGTVWEWSGAADNCQSSPVSILSTSNWCRVSAASVHFLALNTSGEIWARGTNISGQLGDGSTTPATQCKKVVGGFTDWCDISTGDYNSFGIRTNGTLWGWGWNQCGLLGDGTATNRSSPVSVVGGFTDWCQVSAGFYTSAAVRTNGTLWTWGQASGGRLGNNSEVDKCSPVSVVGGFTDWCQVAVGISHSTALRNNGTIWTWGCGTAGRLGDGTIVNKSSPVSVIGGFTDWCYTSSNMAIRACLL